MLRMDFGEILLQWKSGLYHQISENTGPINFEICTDALGIVEA